MKMLSHTGLQNSSTVLCCTILYYAYCIILCYAVLYSTVLILNYTVLYCTQSGVEAPTNAQEGRALPSSFLYIESIFKL